MIKNTYVDDRWLRIYVSYLIEVVMDEIVVDCLGVFVEEI